MHKKGPKRHSEPLGSLLDRNAFRFDPDALLVAADRDLRIVLYDDRAVLAADSHRCFFKNGILRSRAVTRAAAAKIASSQISMAAIRGR